MIFLVKKMYADSIDNLPTDKNALSHSELQIVDSLFSQKPAIEALFNGTKEILLAGILFVVFSTPQVDDLIKKFVKASENSPYILLGVKAILFMVVFFVVKNMYLVRK